jgi:hypothetical protein
VLPCRRPAQAAQQLAQLLADPERRRRLGSIGRARMGGAGASERLAALIEQRLLG